MKLATVIVGTDAERFGRVGANPERLALANQIARFVENEGAALCVMPAGYLTATSGRPTAIRSSAAQLASIFAVDLVAGIDAGHTTIGAMRRGAAEVGARVARPRGGWPFWGMFSRSGRVGSVFQQRTVYPGEETDDVEARVMDVASRRVGLLICGEVYNPALAASLGDERPDFAVDIGHRSMGRGFTSTLRNAAAAAGCRVFHAQHVAWRSRGACMWTGTSRRAWAETACDWASYKAGDDRDALWAEVKLWELGDARASAAGGS
ncbi:MAG: hypothetical protein E6J91_16660 [Deltaproteobacteria bacterium]|nr:MAG: hypothetical protein E6J91_16660 [Deltaproteobacteria bacterium]